MSDKRGHVMQDIVFPATDVQIPAHSQHRALGECSSGKLYDQM